MLQKKTFAKKKLSQKLNSSKKETLTKKKLLQKKNSYKKETLAKKDSCKKESLAKKKVSFTINLQNYTNFFSTNCSSLRVFA